MNLIRFLYLGLSKVRDITRLAGWLARNLPRSTRHDKTSARSFAPSSYI